MASGKSFDLIEEIPIGDSGIHTDRSSYLDLLFKKSPIGCKPIGPGIPEDGEAMILKVGKNGTEQILLKLTGDCINNCVLRGTPCCVLNNVIESNPQ